MQAVCDGEKTRGALGLAFGKLEVHWHRHDTS